MLQWFNSFTKKTVTLDSTLTWTPLLYGNGKRHGSHHLLIEQRKYAQRKPSEKTPIDKKICILERLQSIKKFASWSGYNR